MKEEFNMVTLLLTDLVEHGLLSADEAESAKTIYFEGKRHFEATDDNSAA